MLFFGVAVILVNLQHVDSFSAKIACFIHFCGSPSSEQHSILRPAGVVALVSNPAVDFLPLSIFICIVFMVVKNKSYSIQNFTCCVMSKLD